MATIAVFHPSFGVDAGVLDAAERLRAAGHRVVVVDQYAGTVFADGDYDAAAAFVDTIGFPELMRRAVDGVADLPDGFVALGFSNGGGMAEHVAQMRRVSAVVVCSGATPLEVIGAASWPVGVPLQLHAMADDPRRVDGAVESLMRAVTDAGADAEYAQYPGAGHLFTDPAVPEEFDPEATERFWRRVLDFVDERG